MTGAVARVFAAAVAGVAIGLVFEPNVQDAVRVALLFALAAVVALVAVRVYEWQSDAEELQELELPTSAAGEWRIPQLDAARLQARAAGSSADAMHRFFRPVLVELTAARLARRYGTDLQREPEAAQALVSPELWDIVRSNRPAPHETHGRGLSMRRLRALVSEVERI